VTLRIFLGRVLFSTARGELPGFDKDFRFPSFNNTGEEIERNTATSLKPREIITPGEVSRCPRFGEGCGFDFLFVGEDVEDGEVARHENFGRTI
jgi:hypothetical protein